MVELKQTKLSDRSTVGRVWDSEFEGYRFDSRNRQIFATSENSKIYFSNIIQIICYLETLICLIIFVNNIDLLQVVLIYSLMSLNVLILRSKNSLQTDCIISRFEYTVSLNIAKISPKMVKKGPFFDFRKKDLSRLLYRTCGSGLKLNAVFYHKTVSISNQN